MINPSYSALVFVQESNRLGKKNNLEHHIGYY